MSLIEYHREGQDHKRASIKATATIPKPYAAVTRDSFGWKWNCAETGPFLLRIAKTIKFKISSRNIGLGNGSIPGFSHKQDTLREGASMETRNAFNSLIIAQDVSIES